MYAETNCNTDCMVTSSWMPASTPDTTHATAGYYTLARHMAGTMQLLSDSRGGWVGCETGLRARATGIGSASARADLDD